VAATLLVPLALLLAGFVRPVRQRMPRLLALAPLPALATALVASGAALPQTTTLLGATFVLDATGAMLLGAVALLWIAAGATASATLRGDPKSGLFCLWWLLTLLGSLGVFLAADLVSFYLFYSLVSLAAWGLIVHDGTASVRRAGAVSVSIAVLGEAFLLLGFVLLEANAPGEGLLIRDGVAALPASPMRDATLACLVLGFGLKIGLVPLHVWMPLAYAAAPHPAAAVLSGAAVKAGVIGLIRFLPLEAALPGWGDALTVAGLLSAFYGVAVGITQANPKSVLAYSSVSQMGLIAAVLGMGLAAGDAGAAAGASFTAAHHVLVKGALFLALGVVATSGARGAWPVLLPAAVLALGLGGLPLTGGALAKWAVKEPLGEGAVGLLANLSAAGSTLLMLHFLNALVKTAAKGEAQPAPAGLCVPWLAMALASVAVPWTLFLTVAHGSPHEVFAPAALGKAFWPVALGAALAVALRRFGHALPSVPEGDLVVVAERATRALGGLGEAVERVDGFLRQWPVAGVSLLALAVFLGALMLE
jgi:formate hydrogenlyase subunit 3/multisubunit Na+/H+ antiporter MnhD subunit